MLVQIFTRTWIALYMPYNKSHGIVQAETPYPTIMLISCVKCLATAINFLLIFTASQIWWFHWLFFTYNRVSRLMCVYHRYEWNNVKINLFTTIIRWYRFCVIYRESSLGTQKSSWTCQSWFSCMLLLAWPNFYFFYSILTGIFYIHRFVTWRVCPFNTFCNISLALDVIGVPGWFWVWLLLSLR